jgi:hypothetical protein
VVVARELVLLAREFVQDKFDVSKAVSGVKQLLFDPYVAGQGVLCGTVWTGTFAIRKRQSGVRITITLPPYTVVITIG